jgi:hypothetical protein
MRMHNTETEKEQKQTKGPREKQQPTTRERKKSTPRSLDPLSGD